MTAGRASMSFSPSPCSSSIASVVYSSSMKEMKGAMLSNECLASAMDNLSHTDW